MGSGKLADQPPGKNAKRRTHRESSARPLKATTNKKETENEKRERERDLNDRPKKKGLRFLARIAFFLSFLSLLCALQFGAGNGHRFFSASSLAFFQLGERERQSVTTVRIITWPCGWEEKKGGEELVGSVWGETVNESDRIIFTLKRASILVTVMAPGTTR